MHSSEPQAGSHFSEKQLAILTVAESLFAERGYEGTSVRDIALEAKVNVAMISYYFGSKEKLLESIVVARIAAGRLVLEHLVNDKSLHPLAKIELLVDGIVERMMSQQSFHRIMLRAQLDGDNKVISSILSEMKLKNLDLVRKLVLEGQRKKVFVKGVDVALLMMTMIGTIYQAATGSHYLRVALQEEDAAEKQYAETVKKKLKAHLKNVFKATLTYNEK